MSNRSLFEFNHDHSHTIEANQESFCRALQMYLSSGSRESAERLKLYGVRVFGMRHHTDGFAIAWGGHYETKEKS